jgi:hypothetical protein
MIEDSHGEQKKYQETAKTINHTHAWQQHNRLRQLQKKSRIVSFSRTTLLMMMAS